MASTPMKQVEIFTDGACSGNPGPGGWGALLRYGDNTRELSGGESPTTNNRMELMAVIKALEVLKQPCDVIVHTDSQYLKNGITSWIHKWKKNNWRTSNKEPVKNKDLWETLDRLASTHRIEWKWVRGHSGHPENERCDELARLAIRSR